MPKPWRLASALVALRTQINCAAPGRVKIHDGTIGDTAHAARKSDHNPDANGVVCALDVTNDPKNGCDCDSLAEKLVKSRDPRIKYIIWEGRIISSKVEPWVWRKYTGANQHMKHLHISVMDSPKLYDDSSPWKII